MSNWAYFRLFCLPMLIHGVATKFVYAPEHAELQPYITMSAVFLGFLLFLHFYWFHLFVKIAYKAIFKGELKDTQSDVTKIRNIEKEKEL